MPKPCAIEKSLTETDKASPCDRSSTFFRPLRISESEIGQRNVPALTCQHEEHVPHHAAQGANPCQGHRRQRAHEKDSGVLHVWILNLLFGRLSPP